MRIVAHQYGCPTYATDIADAILLIAANFRKGHQIRWGIYNYCGAGVTAWYGFAQAIFDRVKGYESLVVRKVEPITTAEYPTPAKRPANSALECTLITKSFGISPKP